MRVLLQRGKEMGTSGSVWETFFESLNTSSGLCFGSILTYAFSRVPFRFWRTLYPRFGYLVLKEVLTPSTGVYPAVPILSVRNFKYLSAFMLLPREMKIG